MKYFDKRKECPVCLSTSSQIIISCSYDQEPVKDYVLRTGYCNVDLRILSTGTYRLRQCENCRLIYQEEVPNKSMQYILYEKWLDLNKMQKDHLQTDNLDLYKYYAFDVMFLIEMLAKLPSEIDILDYGFGLGKWAQMAKSFGCNVYGCELSPSRRRIAKRVGIEIVSDKDAKKYDVINLDQVLEHVPQPVELLKKYKIYLKKNGFFKIAVPDGSRLESNLTLKRWQVPRYSKDSIMVAAPLEHINCFNRTSFDYLLSAAGLKRVRIPFKSKASYIVSNFIFPLNLTKAAFYRAWDLWRYLDSNTMALAQPIA